LRGSEVKSLREAKAQLADAYAYIDRGEAWLHGLHISPYGFAHGFGAHDPDRDKKLLLHKVEIDERAIACRSRN
jgi:SsrA-binding protein